MTAEDRAVERRRRPRAVVAEQIRIIVAGNQPLYRAALSCLIQRDRRYRVIGESALDATALQRAVESNTVPIVVIDFDIAASPGHRVRDLEALLDSVAGRPAIVVASAIDADACQCAIRHGASGIVLKTSEAGVLLAAIDTIHRGQVWLDRSLVPSMFGQDAQRIDVPAFIGRLTNREREIVRVACTGGTNKEIAGRLRISEATVRHHLGSIFAKLGVSTRSELVGFAYRHNLMSPAA